MEINPKVRFIVRKLISSVKILQRRSLSYLRRIFIRASFPEVHISCGASIASGVRLEATDGGSIKVGSSVTIENGAWIIANGGSIQIGDSSFIGRGSMIISKGKISIGNDVLIGEYVSMRDQDHFASFGEIIRLNGFKVGVIRVASNVWIGTKAVILKDVEIGEGSVIGAGSIVTKNIPANIVALGVPAKVTKKIFAADAKT